MEGKSMGVVKARQSRWAGRDLSIEGEHALTHDVKLTAWVGEGVMEASERIAQRHVHGHSGRGERRVGIIIVVGEPPYEAARRERDQLPNEGRVVQRVCAGENAALTERNTRVISSREG